MGFDTIGVEYLLALVVGPWVALTIALIAARSFLRLILLLFAMSLALPLAARMGPEQLVELQSLVKLGVLGLGVVTWALSFLVGRRLKMNRTVRLYAVLYLISLAFFLFRAMYDWAGGAELQEIGRMFRRFSFPYMLLAIVIYQQTDDLAWVQGFLKALVACGIALAAFGVFQWVVGPDRLQAMGMNLSIGREVFHSTRDPATGRKFFRVFSTLGNHYDFSAFMIITVLAALTLYWTRRMRLVVMLTSAGLMALGLLATYNNTSLLVLVSAAGLAAWRLNRQLSRERSSKFMLSKRTLAMMLLMLLLVGLAATDSGFRTRIVGSVSTTAGISPSLLPRIRFWQASIRALKDKPWGWGVESAAGVSMDLYLAYVLVCGGAQLFVFYVWLYILPVLYGWRAMRGLRGRGRRINVLYCVLWAWVSVGALIGTLSNSHVTQASPSNILFWSAVGLVFKIPTLVQRATPSELERWGMSDPNPSIVARSIPAVAPSREEPA